MKLTVKNYYYRRVVVGSQEEPTATEKDPAANES
jgi:hypothetical protein